MAALTPALLAAACAAALAATWAGTGAVRRYAVARQVLDIPNERSSHTVPTPRGGGVAIAAVLLTAVAAMGAAGVLQGGVAAALALGGAAVAGVGWLDDHRPLPAWLRAGVHLAAAAWALFWLGGLPELTVGSGRVHLGGVGTLLGAVGIVWVTNLYNFMDGIDGIAGVEAVTAGAIGGVLLLACGQGGLAAAAFLVAASGAGFLVWNWPPARIFMGDAGSGLLGYVFAVLAVASENARAVPLLAWAVLLGVFVVDATVTLARRLQRRERVHQAHRSHAYQRAVQGGLSHLSVTATVAVVNLVLGLLAALAVLRPALLLPVVAAAVALLLVLYAVVERRAPMRRVG
jgi:Fuc2NAc and GlcNAc transferase